MYRISELEKILSNNSFTIDEKLINSVHEEELVDKILFNLRVAEIISLLLNLKEFTKE
ncbi:MAG: hypothetical protein QXF76_00240 [Candidatus Anstonellales archaeon]